MFKEHQMKTTEKNGCNQLLHEISESLNTNSLKDKYNFQNWQAAQQAKAKNKPSKNEVSLNEALAANVGGKGDEFENFIINIPSQQISQRTSDDGLHVTVPVSHLHTQVVPGESTP